MSLPVPRILLSFCIAVPILPSFAQQVNITSPATLPAGMVGRPYSQTLTASGGSGQYTWTRVSSANSVPAGVSLSTNGVLSGSPSAATSSPASFSIRATDTANNSRTDTQSFSLSILPSLSVTTTSLPAGTQGTLYNATLQASGGSTPYTWSINGNLPTGVVLNSTTGVLLGLPLNSGAFNITASVKDNAGFTATRDLTITVASVVGPSITSTSPLPPATAGRAYSVPMNASGGIAPYIWSLQGTLPAWATINPNTGVLSGTPVTAGPATIRVRAADAVGLQDTKDFSLLINAALAITSNSPLPAGMAGQPYTQTLAASGGTAPLTWSLSGNPAWLSINPTTGALSGSSSTSGAFNFMARLSDANGATAEKAMQVTIQPAADPPTITTSSLPDWTVGRPYAQTLQATGGSGALSWSVSSGQLPPGLTLNASSGAISGTPTTAGPFPFVVSVQGTTRSYTVTINAVPAITTAALPNGTAGQSYSATLLATGGTSPLTWSATPPGGLTLNSSTGAITGTPSTAGTTNIAVQVTDATGATTNRQVPITIAGTPIVISNASLPSGMVNQSYTATLQATGGTGTGYNWTLASGTLPAGLTFNPATGVISGTPSAPGTSNLTIRVTDSASGNAEKALTLTIAGPPLTITTNALPDAMRGVSYSITLQAEGGSGTGYAFSLSSGTLPAGLSLSPAGSISGTPSQPGNAVIVVQVRDGAGAVANKTLSIAVADSNLVITSTTLPRGTIGNAYSATAAASGGTPPYTWSVAVGSLPAGLTLNPGTGAITGTPTAAGTFNLTLQVRDANTVTAQSNFSIVVVSFNITPGTLPGGTTNSPYGATLLSENGVAPVVFSLQSGTLPAGVVLNPNGQISGTPTQSGTFNVTVQARDASGAQTTRQLALVIASDLSFSADSLPGGTVGMAYPSATLGASGGSGSYVFTLAPGAALPPGLTLSPSGAISGTPAGPAGTSTFTVRVTDSSNAIAERQFTIAIGARGGNLSITTSALENTPAGVPYSATLAASGGTPPYTWALAQGSNVPAGLALAPNGALSGTANTPGNYSFTVRVQDAANPSASATKNLALTVGPAAPSITTQTLPPGSVGTNYSATLASTGGVAPFNWSISQGELPAGVNLVANSGQLTGIPTVAGTYVFTIRMTDSAGASASRAFTVVVAPALTISTSALGGGTAGVPYSQTLAATGGTGSVFWVVSNGSLPPGLTLASASGVISGTPTTDGVSQFTIQVVDQAGNSATRPFSITIGASLSITTDALPSASVGVAYNQRVTAAGGMPPLQWSTTGVLPAGLTFNPTTGAITGTPTTVANYQFTVVVQDANGISTSKQYSVSVSEGVTITTPTALPNATEASAYSQTLNAAGGVAPYKWAITVGSLPAGLTFDTATGAISGVPTAGGSYSFIVQATDASGQVATKAFTLTVSGLVTIATPSSLPPAVAGANYNESLIAAGGLAPYTWSLTADSALPDGISLASTGTLTGTPLSAGTATFSVQVTDSQNVSSTKSFTLSIGGGLTITTSQLQPAVAGVAYAQALSVTGGQGPYTWSVKSGSLPPGLSLSPEGILSGTPAATGSFPITLEVLDGARSAATIDTMLTVSVPGPPPVLLTGIPETLDPASQPRINVSLAAAFPAPITGTLTASFDGNAAVPGDDPALVFTNGSRTVTFTIPSNTTQAQLPAGLAIQSGTVAGTLRVSVRLRSGDQDVTPDPMPVQVSTIRRMAPVIRQVTARRDAQNSQIVIDIVGFSTSREVTQGTFRFTPAAGVSLQTTELTVSLAAPAKQWYESDEGKRFGSLFTLNQRFTVQGNLNDIANVTVTLTNAEGSSQTMSAGF